MERPIPKTKGLTAYFDLREMNEYLAQQDALIAHLKAEVQYWKMEATKPR
jgi:hypothetical protein